MRGFDFCCLDCDSEFTSLPMMEAHWYTTGHGPSISQRVVVEDLPRPTTPPKVALLDDNGDDLDDDDA